MVYNCFQLFITILDKNLYKKIKMNLTDIKIFFLNTTAIGVSLINIDDALKILLLIVSVGYTAQKWYLINKNRNK